MNTHSLSFAVDIAAILSVAIVGANFLISQPRSFNARLWALISFNTVCYLIFSRYIYSHLIPAPYQIDPGVMLLPVRFAMNLTPGLFMILAHSLFQDGRQVPRWLLAAFLAQVLLEEPIPLALSIDVALGDFVFETVPALLQLLFTCLAMYWTIEDWRADTVEDRRILRAVFLLIIGVVIIISVVLGRVLVVLDLVSPLTTYLLSSVLCAILGVLGVFTALRMGTHFFTEPGKSRKQVSQATDKDQLSDGDVATVKRAFEQDHVYQQPGLSIGSLAATLAIPEYRLRKIIHQKLGYRNFNALVHNYRVQEATRRLCSPDEHNVPILTIALSVGYGSINPFNRAFRELHGMTPSEYRAHHSQTPPPTE